MVEGDNYCVDILKQTYVVRRANERMESILLEGYLQTRTVEGIKNGREEETIQEFNALYMLVSSRSSQLRVDRYSIHGLV